MEALHFSTGRPPNSPTTDFCVLCHYHASTSHPRAAWRGSSRRLLHRQAQLNPLTTSTTDGGSYMANTAQPPHLARSRPHLRDGGQQHSLFRSTAPSRASSSAPSRTRSSAAPRQAALHRRRPAAPSPSHLARSRPHLRAGGQQQPHFRNNRTSSGVHPARRLQTLCACPAHRTQLFGAPPASPPPALIIARAVSNNKASLRT